MKNILAFIGLLVVLGGVAYWYLSRPIKDPTTTSIETDITSLTGDLYGIDASASHAQFAINEILRDKPFTAVGATQDISGTISVNDNALAFTSISVNARTLKTDSPQRDGALARIILKSESPENEFITFTPTGFNRLPTVLPRGSEFSFQLLGDLTISGVTHPEIFDVTLSITDTAIKGIATTTLTRGDYGLTVPNIPFVASVDDSFPVTVTIVANKAQ